MSGSFEAFVRLVKSAHSGRTKLPAFQRQFKWTASQVVLLFDSIRQGYPLGGMIRIAGSREALGPRTFMSSSNDAEEKETKDLILDGQQRITAGIRLFISDVKSDNAKFFIDLESLYNNFESSGVDIKDKEGVQVYVDDLDITDLRYIKAKRSKNPYALLNSSKLLYTPLLLQENSADYDSYIKSFLEVFPVYEEFLSRVVKPHFSVGEGPQVPVIDISDEFALDAISRIFKTLNSTGKMLTPFELVVAVMFPHEVDLRKEIAEAKKSRVYYPNVDSSSEIVLQTVLNFAGKEHKRSKIPQNLNKEIWEKYKNEAWKWLDEAGKFCTERLGMGLDMSDKLVPYDSLFMPLAAILRRIEYDKIAGEDLASVNAKIARWFIGSSLLQRYQEGVHNKQTKDIEQIVAWIKDDSNEPTWITEFAAPSLQRESPYGARGKIIRALANRKKLLDPVNEKEVGAGSADVEIHHIFPGKFVNNLTGWEKSKDNHNIIFNWMNITAETNKLFTNEDPSSQIELAKKKNPHNFKDAYSSQGIDDNAQAILFKKSKTRKDFYDFIAVREQFFLSLLEKEGFVVDGAVASDVQDFEETIDDGDDE